MNNKRNRSRQQKIKKKLKKQVLKRTFTQLTDYKIVQFQHFIDKMCSICQYQFQQDEKNVLKMSKCLDHFFHSQCIRLAFGQKQYLKCPICGIIYGQLIGDQPDGDMIITKQDTPCEGFDCGTIVIEYVMKGGFKNGIKFPGTHRLAYLPDNIQGKQVLRLLKKAFERKLIFSVGRSVTTGQQNRIVWAGIHHKTNKQGGLLKFGWPDNSYFIRVKQQLAIRGII